MNNKKPASNEFEFSLFGPGTGECIVIHYGDNQWFILDSFKEKNEPIAKLYLESLGVNLATDVKHIVATHFDDDHCEGIYELLANCDNAVFYCSQALSCNEFFQCVLKNKKLKTVETSAGLRAFSDILEFLKGQSPILGLRKSKFGPNYLRSGMNLQLSNDVRVRVLSPSNQTIIDSGHDFNEIFLSDPRPLRVNPYNSRNMTSVAMIFETSGLNFILGADLERGGNDYVGWRGVLADHTLEKPLSDIFKIPHHGSSGADIDEMWTKLLNAKPLLAMTSYAASGLPEQTDIRRLQTRRPSGILITNPNYFKRPKKHGAADRQMASKTKRRKLIRREMGQICIRSKIGSNSYNVQLFGAAASVN